MDAERNIIIPRKIATSGDPWSVRIIGCGGTGLAMLHNVVKMALTISTVSEKEMVIEVMDGDVVEESNIGRQMFIESELGVNKALAVTQRYSRAYNIPMKPITRYFEKGDKIEGNFTIICVDTVKARKRIVAASYSKRYSSMHQSVMLMDLGNGFDFGQCIMWNQESQNIFDMHPEMLKIKDDDEPSCSLAMALSKQDLFINSMIANLGAIALWDILKYTFINYNAIYLNLKDMALTKRYL